MTSNFSKQKNEYDEEIKNLFEKVKILEQSLKTEKELIESKTEQIEKFLKLNKELSDLVTQNKNSYNSEKKQTERLLAELEVQKSENSELILKFQQDLNHTSSINQLKIDELLQKNNDLKQNIEKIKQLMCSPEPVAEGK